MISRMNNCQRSKVKNKYSRLLTRSEFILLHKGEPAATLIKELVHLGIRWSQKLRYERDIASVLYDSAKEAVLSYKLELRNHRESNTENGIAEASK